MKCKIFCTVKSLQQHAPIGFESELAGFQICDIRNEIQHRFFPTILMEGKCANQ